MALALAAAPALAQEPRDTGGYEDCLAIARESPDEGFEQAIAWRDEGGGAPAKHCVAVALVQLGHYEEAAGRLEALSEELGGQPNGMRAALLQQAGHAWLLGERNSRAYAAFSAALSLDPDNVDLLIDRSVVLAAAASYWEAIDDLNAALGQAPNRVDALVFRASAWRYLDALDLARDDLDRALTLAPRANDALLERGIVRRLDGDTVGARDDWMAVIRDDPESQAAEIARRNLEKLDVRVD